MAFNRLQLTNSDDWTTDKKKAHHGLTSPRKLTNPMKSIKTAATTGARNIKKNIDKEKEERREKKKERTPDSQESIIMKPLPPIPKTPLPKLPTVEEAKPPKSKRKKIQRRIRKKKAGSHSRLRRLTESQLEIKRVLETPPEYQRSASSQSQYPYEVYTRLAENLFDAMGLDRETKKQMISSLQSAPCMQQQKNNHMCSERAVGKVEKMAKDIAKFSSYQYANGAALLVQSAFRAYVAQKERDRIRNEWNQARVDAWSSLIKREKTYVFNLATVVSQYVMPLQVTTDKQLKQIAGDLKLIFSNLEQILSVHHSFLDSLYGLSESTWPQLNGLGELFVSISPHWRAYGIYIQNFKFARDLLFECMTKCDKFSQFLDERTMELSTDLNMLLSLPLNHIAGYELILKKFLTETEEGSAENTSILQALVLTEETSKFIANALGKAANVANIERVKRNIMELPAEICLEISKPSTHFEKEVQVEFCVPTAKKMSQGVLFIFQKLVILAISSVRGLAYRHSYDLSTLTVQSNEQDSRAFSCLIIDEERPAYDNIVEGSQYDFLVDDRDKLVKELKELVSRNQLTRTFGVDLRHIVERENPEDGVPRVVKDLISYLDNNGLDDMGLFRIPGTSTVVKKLRFEYNQSFVTGKYPNLEEMEEFRPNDAAGLLKMFFHDLPEPLIPYRMFNGFLSSQVDYDTTEEKTQCLTELIHSPEFPDVNYRILKFLIAFMVRVVANQEVNKMGAENLAMCFGPNILQPEEQTMESTLSIPKTNGCIALMIVYYDSMFTRE